LLNACVPVPPLPAEPSQAVATAVQQVAAAPEMTSSPTPAPTSSSTRAAPTETAIVTYTPAATRTAPAASEATATLAPTRTPLPSRTPAVKSAAVAPARTATRTPTKSPTSTATRAATATATVDRHHLVITEGDITKAIAAGAGAQQGVKIQNLKVSFAGGKIHITADQLGYGIVQVRNLDMVGRLVANNGVLNLQVESISPRGLAANMIPSVANQAIAQYGSKWYVEDVKTLDGRVELRIR
jgi:hypothetical protein